MKYITSLIGLLFCLGSCSTDGNDNEQETTAIHQAEKLPLLKRSNSIGIIRGFNPTNPPATIDSINTRWQEALASGMRVGRLQIDWPELEPQKSTFDTEILENQLTEAMDNGLQSFLLISAYDSEGPVLPTDLEGLPLNSFQVITRFKALMDWVIPMLVEHKGYAISISNEADVNFEDLPNLNKELLDFVKEIKAHIHSINPQMAVTVTFAEGSLTKFPEQASEIIAACDVACFNFYGAESTATPPYNKNLNENEIKADIQQMLQIAGAKNVLIQELGMHTDMERLNSSEEIQRKFFEVFFGTMQRENRIRAAYVFQLVDWSEEATELFRAFFTDDATSIDFFESYAASLKSLGMLTYEDGTQRPAWNEFLKWLSIFN